MFCLTDCQRSTFDHTGLARWYVNEKRGKCGDIFQILKCMYPLTSHPLSKNLFFRHIHTWTQRCPYQEITAKDRTQTKRPSTEDL